MRIRLPVAKYWVFSPGTGMFRWLVLELLRARAKEGGMSGVRRKLFLTSSDWAPNRSAFLNGNGLLFFALAGASAQSRTADCGGVSCSVFWHSAMRANATPKMGQFTRYSTGSCQIMLTSRNICRTWIMYGFRPLCCRN